MAENNVTVVARIKAKPGLEEQVKKELLGLVAPTRSESGCINYDLHQSLDDSNLFVFYENWTSKKDLEEHLEKPHLQAFKAKAEELLAEPLDISLLQMISDVVK